MHVHQGYSYLAYFNYVPLLLTWPRSQLIIVSTLINAKWPGNEAIPQPHGGFVAFVYALHYIVNAFNHVTVMSGQLKLSRFLRSAFRSYVSSGVSCSVI